MSPDDHISSKSSPSNASANTHPTRSEAEEAVRTLIKWMGDDPTREGLIDTPKRVINSYAELFSGYTQNPSEILERTFEETDGYGDIVLLKDIRVESYCEHHLIPITGVAHVAYIPENRVVGISKLARTVELFSKRLQIQEKLTSQVANAINDTLKPKHMSSPASCGGPMPVGFRAKTGSREVSPSSRRMTKQEGIPPTPSW